MSEKSVPNKYHVPLRNRLARSILQPTFRALFYVLSPIRITGRENIPKHGAYMIAFNHISLADAPFLVAFWPRCPEVVGAIDVWNRKGQSILARWYYGIPVHRGKYDRQVLKNMLAAVDADLPLLISPEGGRSHKPGLRRAFTGVAYVMSKADVPVIPVGIVGATEDYIQKAFKGKRPPLEMHVGKPLHLPQVSGTAEQRKIARQQNADLVMAYIARLLPPDYRGVYADHPAVSGEDRDPAQIE
jgi:1-acyl-sn-glycerol-3-phosphate acyltransferase